jgi:hypothetical protein
MIKKIKVKRFKRRYYPTEAQAKYIIDLREARRLRKMFIEG